MIRFQNICSDCGFTWYPRPHKCPHCKSRSTGINYTPPLIVVVILLSGALVWALQCPPKKAPSDRGSPVPERVEYHKTEYYHETIREIGPPRIPSKEKTPVTDFTPLPKPKKPCRATVEPKEDPLVYALPAWERKPKTARKPRVTRKPRVVRKPKIEQVQEQVQEQDCYSAISQSDSKRACLRIKSDMGCWDTRKRSWGLMGAVVNDGYGKARNVKVRITVVLRKGPYTFERALPNIYPGGVKEFEVSFRSGVYVEDYSLEVIHGDN